MMPTDHRSTRLSCPFLRLPRELRNQIYKHSLGSNPIKTRYGRSIVVATQGLPRCEDATTTTRGLPVWLRTSRIICSEALDVFGSTRTFTAIDYGANQAWTYKAGYYDLGAPPSLNPLVFNANVIRNVCIVKRLKEASSPETDRKFLLALSRLRVHNIHLVTEWSFSGQPEDWGKEIKVYTEDWVVRYIKSQYNEFLNGRLQKAKIIITTYVPSFHTTAVLDKAETFAMQLVGPGGIAIRGGCETDNDQNGGRSVMKRSVVVERKI